ncbi:MAG: ATP-dependent RNA helicase HrpA [Ilumatobacter sp.]|nr:MAG: ATP-dependent RNA helicase HrpA [Ilumatobacter sp.]
MIASGRLTYDEALPITHRRDDLLAAIRDHQVVVVAGETGSGKSTQLPKMCLELGRGVQGLIGHTQPRRVAARTIAQRVASELGTTVGDVVGSSVRFDDRVGDATAVRVMTDGILLAELQRDPELRRYDTLIIDEAHERSLNVDFLLGYLRQLLPRRPDLKVIVTSATIDTERFAEHFGAGDGPAPVIPAPIITVTGRTYPVEVRYRPFGADADTSRDAGRDADDPAPADDRDQVQAVCDAVVELQREGPGDVLVFFSGEREIHDAADALRELELPGTEILPLYARLSSAEQQRVFQPHHGRRIVLATNVAETSITVPGVRYVVDTGLARISRYSRRLKVQQLPIEPVSRASADQRAGRCGRVAPGICIRLYTEDDYVTRPEFTEPEILRTNLASVILQMTAIGLGDVVAFPFLEPPDSASIRDGYLLLDELGAIDEEAGGGQRDGERRLTPVGRKLARLPIDPRLGRMVLEADRENCVREVLVIASALSIQDPRERPQEHLQAATELHRRFDVPGSDLLSIVALWDHLRERQRQLSSNQFRKMCKAEYLHHLRIREWSDLFSQLRRVAGQVGVRPGTEAGHPDHVHRAVMAGLLSQIGMRDPQGREYIGARNSRFVVARGSVLTRSSASKNPPRWIMAAELVETNRIYARRVATIQPEWAEQLGSHLVKRSYGDPRWDAKAGRAVCGENVTLYGLPIVQNRTVGYDRVDPAEARAWFIRHALVEGDWRTNRDIHDFVERNEAFRERVRAMEDRVRRSDLLDDDAVFEFFDARVGDEVVSTRHFDRWWKTARRDDPHLLDLTDEVLRSSAGFRFADWPDSWRQGDVELDLTYRFDPGSPLDGVTVHVPVTVLNQVSAEGFDWHVPGHRFDVVTELYRSLPKDLRRRLHPANETVNAAFDRLAEPPGQEGAHGSARLLDAWADALAAVAGVPVRADDFDPGRLSDHLRPAFVVEAADGTVLDAGRDLEAIRRRLASTTRAAVAAAAPVEERRGITTWDIGSLPKLVETRSTDHRSDHTVRGYPALLDERDSVSIRVLTNPDLQARVMRGGVRRLLLLTVPIGLRAAKQGVTRSTRLTLAAADVELADLAIDASVAAVGRVLDDHVASTGDLPWDEAAFAALRDEVRRRAPSIAAETLLTACDVIVLETAVRDRLARLGAGALADTVADATAQLDRLVRPGFVVRAGVDRLHDVLRYVRGIEHRLEHLGGDIGRDHRRMAEVLPLEQRYASYLRSLGDRPAPPEAVDLGWLLEELRISVFAQPLGVRRKVSSTRIARALTELSAPIR